MQHDTKLSIVFVCQAGDLEIKAGLLAASIRQFHSASEVELIACTPHISGVAENPGTHTESLFSELDVSIRHIDSPFGESYPIGNKMAALAVPTRADRTLFLDTDILCLAPLAISGLSEADIQFKPVDLHTFEIQWQKIYEKFNLELPAGRVFTSVDQQYILPYFNAGVISVSDNQNFAHTWMETSKAIEADQNIENKRPWLDQLSLPVAVERMSMSYRLLGEEYNFPAHNRALCSGVKLCHYHWPYIIREEPELSNIVWSLTTRSPDLKNLLESMDEWAVLLKPYRQSPLNKERNYAQADDKSSSFRTPDITTNCIVTGLPRSGTSLLCNLLDQVADVAVINEPDEIFALLADAHDSRTLELFYRTTRCRILDGAVLKNKIDENGDIIQDTNIADERKDYCPHVQRQDFLLATKNPLAYMARLPMLVQYYQREQIVTCIRHPYDTIRSWVTSFVHLQKVLLDRFPFGGDADPLLSSWQTEQLRRIRLEESEVTRRALLWRYLAQLIWTNRNRLSVVRYEDLTRQPYAVLSELLSSWDGYVIPEQIGSGVDYRQRKDELDEQDKIEIRRLCSDVARLFNYSL